MSIVYVTANCSDRCQVSFEEKDVVGYVPRIPGLGGGDYIRLSIENETGKIIGWNPITEEDLDN